MTLLRSLPASSGLDGWENITLFHTETLKNSAFTWRIFLYCPCPIPPSQGLGALLAASIGFAYRRSLLFVHAFYHNVCLRYLLQNKTKQNKPHITMLKLKFHCMFLFLSQYFADVTNPFQDSDTLIHSLTEKQNYREQYSYLFDWLAVHTNKEEKVSSTSAEVF